MVSPMYCITVTLCFRQSSQNWDAENFLLRKTVMPVRRTTPKRLDLHQETKQPPVVDAVNRRVEVTSLDGSGHPDEESRTVVQRQVDVEDVV